MTARAMLSFTRLVIAGSAVVVVLAALVWIFSERRPAAPLAALRDAQAFERASLLGDCSVAWGALTQAARAMSEQRDFCKRLPHACTSGSVRLQSSELRGAVATVSGVRQCDGRVATAFTVELEQERGRWAVSTFADGY